MSRKPRTKKYQGKSAKDTKPQVKRFKVEDKSKFERWEEDNKQELILRGVQLGAAGLGGLIIWGIISLVF